MVEDQAKSDVPTKFGRQAIKDWPVSERPREKLLHLGPEGLSDGELLAVLLRIGTSGQSAEDLGRQLMFQFNGVSGKSFFLNLIYLSHLLMNSAQLSRHGNRKKLRLQVFKDAHSSWKSRLKSVF